MVTGTRPLTCVLYTGNNNNNQLDPAIGGL